ncbi:class II aldolase/adducin family protein [Neoaquamicrobium sediminum]|uniref:Class II aldolase/adducin family protein n=1 Tax=Neoaquamicrobium sediminum TaxID=1849104 RepID=A0ABV3WNY9_9HYPH
MREAASPRVELADLRALSARIGSDPLLIQGAGGNTSLKADGILWIKASGTWLAHALERDIMVPVEIAPLLDAVSSVDPAAERAEQFVVAGLGASGLRPSIETTVHALMPQRVVVHVHCVNTIALAVRTDCEAELATRLDGLNWALVRYARPGLPLALAIAEHSSKRPDVLVLANHGLVVAAETVDAAEALLNDVTQRLASEPRSAPPANMEKLRALGVATFRLPESDAAHAVATDPASTHIAARGSLYPDHVIFLGEGSAIARPGEDAQAVIARIGAAPVSIVFPGIGVLMREDATASADAMARCLADVATRIPPGAPLRVLTAEEHLQLTDWDAEKYRQELARKAARKSA